MKKLCEAVMYFATFLMFVMIGCAAVIILNEYEIESVNYNILYVPIIIIGSYNIAAHVSKDMFNNSDN